MTDYAMNWESVSLRCGSREEVIVLVNGTLHMPTVARNLALEVESIKFKYEGKWATVPYDATTGLTTITFQKDAVFEITGETAKLVRESAEAKVAIAADQGSQCVRCGRPIMRGSLHKHRFCRGEPVSPEVLLKITELAQKAAGSNWRQKICDLERNTFQANSSHPCKGMIDSLKIPVDPLNPDIPSLLLHNLGSLHDDPDVKAVLSRLELVSILPLIGPSGSGKTRVILESLLRKFGFFLTVIDPTAPSPGSRDLSSIITHLKKEAEENHSSLPRPFAKHLFDCLLLARAVVFSAMNQPQNKLTEKEWLFMQLYPNLIFGYDLFDTIASQLTNDGGLVSDEVKTLLGKIKDGLGYKLPVFADEAQALLAEHTKCNLYSPFIEAVTAYPSLVCVPAGTSLNLIRCKMEAFPAVAKPEAIVPVHYMTHIFDTENSFVEYATSCGVPVQVASEAFRACRGRRRFAALHHLAFLKQWPESLQPGTVLTYPPPPYSAFSHLSLYRKFREIDENTEHPRLIDFLLDLADHLVLTGLAIAIPQGKTQALLIAQGVCIVTKRNENDPTPYAALLEPLAVKALLRYCADHPTPYRQGIVTRLQSALMSEFNWCASAQGYLWELRVPFSFQRMFTGDKPLSELTLFASVQLDKCAATRSLQHERFKLFVPCGSVRLISTKRLSDWLVNPDTPFCRADTNAGTDLVFFLVSCSQPALRVLCSAQLRFADRVKEGSYAIATTDLSLAYCDDEQHRAEIQEQLTVLRQQPGFQSVIFRFLLVFPGNVIAKSHMKGPFYDLSSRDSAVFDTHVAVVIDGNTADQLFTKDEQDFFKSVKKQVLADADGKRSENEMD